MHVHSVHLNLKTVTLNRSTHNCSTQFGAVVSLSDAYDLKPKNSQTTEQKEAEAKALKEICHHLGPDELLLVEESDERNRYLFLVNGEDRSMVESLNRLAKHIGKTLPEKAKLLYREVFYHLYETATRTKFPHYNYAYRSVSSAFTLMKNGPIEDKEI